MGVINLLVDHSIPSEDCSEDSGVCNITQGGFQWNSNITDDWMGWRFKNVMLPPGCTIVSASMYLTLGKNAGQVNFADYQFWGEANDNAGTFSTTANDISIRPRTTASFTWNNMPAGYTQVANREYHNVGNPTTIIQELVNRPGWLQGNAFVIVARPLGGGAAAGSRIQTNDDRTNGWPWGAKIDVTWASLAPPIMGSTFEICCDVARNYPIPRNIPVTH